MTSRSIIPVASTPGAEERLYRGNAQPILHEVRHALALLMCCGQPTCIDLRAIPMGPGDEAELEAFLGSGEISATLNSQGESTIRETAYPGVWLITHRDETGQIVSRFIEITFVPDILQSQGEDVRAGLQALTARLAGQLV